jgi:tyrosyl-tRNA synthetase
VADIAAAVQAGGARAGEAKRRMARGVVTLYHGAAAARQAEAAFDATFREHAVPQDVREHRLEGSGDPVHLPTVLVSAGLAASTSAARRLVDSGGVRLDGARVVGYDLPRTEVVGRVLAVGKRQAVRVVEIV